MASDGISVEVVVKGDFQSWCNFHLNIRDIFRALFNDFPPPNESTVFQNTGGTSIFGKNKSFQIISLC